MCCVVLCCAVLSYLCAERRTRANQDVFLKKKIKKCPNAPRVFDFYSYKLQIQFQVS